MSHNSRLGLSCEEIDIYGSPVVALPCDSAESERPRDIDDRMNILWQGDVKGAPLRASQ